MSLIAGPKWAQKKPPELIQAAFSCSNMLVKRDVSQLPFLIAFWVTNDCCELVSSWLSAVFVSVLVLLGLLAVHVSVAPSFGREQ